MRVSQRGSAHACMLHSRFWLGFTQQHREVTELAFRKRRSRRGWRGSLACSCLISLPVSARDGAHCPANVVVDMIFQVCEGYAHRPIRSGKTAAVEQDDAVVLGQPEDDVERVHV